MHFINYQVLTSSLLFSIMFSPFAMSQEVEMENLWFGKVGDNELSSLAPEDLCIANNDAWEKIWSSWKGDEEVPKIDFQKHFVIVGTAPGPNRVNPHMRLDGEAANLKVVFAATRMGGPGFGFVFVEMKREGVKTVNGKPLPAPMLSESIEVTVTGKLAHGVMAIGGETTGTTITANGVTWELELGDNADFRKTAEEKNGKMVKVSGTLTIKQGVERGQRFIVVVDAIK